MKISKRRYEEKLAAVRWDVLGKGQEQGRTEVLDILCNHFGLLRSRLKHNCFAYNAMLEAQAETEGQRLLSYFYEESDVEDIRAFSQRFYDSRKLDTSWVIPPGFPNISQANYSELKAAYSNAILFFRANGNYAVYDDDANFMMELFDINQPSTLVDWLGIKVPVLHFKSWEVSGYTHGVTETGRAVAFAEPLINIEAEVLHLTLPTNQEAA